MSTYIGYAFALRLILMIIPIALFLNAGFTQGISFNENSQHADSSAILDLQSTSRGLLMPRMTSAQRIAIQNPAHGLLLFDNQFDALVFHSGLAWRDTRLGTMDSLWTLSGNQIKYAEGKVGIGMLHPEGLFSIYGQNNTAAYARIHNQFAGGGTSGVALNTQGGNRRISVNNLGQFQWFDLNTGISRMTFGTNGNLGIGIAPGSEKVLVNGNVLATDDLITNALNVNNQITVESYTNNGTIDILAPNADQGGRLRTYSPNGWRNANFSYLSGTPNHGFIQIFGNNEAYALNLWVDASGLGRINPKFSFLRTYHGTPQSSSSGAKTDIYGPNGELNVKISFPSGFYNHGFLGVYDANGTAQATMSVNADGDGVIAADIKNFFVAHPEHPDKAIYYASVEGPELAAYVRGTAQLIDGEAIVEFPDHFRIVVNAASMTIQTTPMSLHSKGLAIVERTASGFKVKELHAGNGTYAFDWEAKSVRNGKEDFQVIRHKRDSIQGQ